VTNNGGGDLFGGGGPTTILKVLFWKDEEGPGGPMGTSILSHNQKRKATFILKFQASSIAIVTLLCHL